jgi:K+-sensing histidine kinase KdpD
VKTKKVKAIVLVGIVVSLLAIGVVDHLTGLAVSLSFFYLIPVAFAALLYGSKGGAICAACATAVYFSIQLLDHMGLGLAVWNAVQRFGVLLVVGVLLPVAVAKVNEALTQEEDATGRR